ncbi:MAG TPA: hypothetical protein VJY15_23755 [Candidatus Acidoferrum sp.]|nr:hypothetical protein [Candidatus Acidoferrum sp.]
MIDPVYIGFGASLDSLASPTCTYSSTWSSFDFPDAANVIIRHFPSFDPNIQGESGHPQSPLATGQTTPSSSVRLTIMTLAWSTSDRAQASRADVEHSSMARRNRAEVVVADQVGVYRCVQRVVRRAFLCGVDPLSGISYNHRRSWIRDRLESLAGLFGQQTPLSSVSSISRGLPDFVTLSPPWQRLMG